MKQALIATTIAFIVGLTFLITVWVFLNALDKTLYPGFTLHEDRDKIIWVIPSPEKTDAEVDVLVEYLDSIGYRVFVLPSEKQ